LGFKAPAFHALALELPGHTLDFVKGICTAKKFAPPQDAHGLDDPAKV
jgi:hypothetical protein